jgi:hypothetical protein
MNTIEQCTALFQQLGYGLLTIFTIIIVNTIIHNFKETIKFKLREIKEVGSFTYKIIQKSLILEKPAYVFATFLLCFMSYKYTPSNEIKDGKKYYNNKVVINCKTKEAVKVKKDNTEVAFLSNFKSCKHS